jgi:hypothetical protein
VKVQCVLPVINSLFKNLYSKFFLTVLSSSVKHHNLLLLGGFNVEFSFIFECLII